MPTAHRVPLFVIGSPRSGTTFLVQLMNRFLDIHIVRDAGVFLRFHKLLPHYGDLSEKANIRKLTLDLYNDYFFQIRLRQRGLTTDAATLLDTLPETSFPALAEHIMSECARCQGKSYWGNKMPSYALNMSELNAIFPMAKFIHIIRDGRDVALSMRKATGAMFDRNWYYAAKDWKTHVLAGRRYGTMLGAERYLEIRYEALVQRPVEVFTTIVEFMGDSPRNRAGLAEFSQQIHTLIKPGNFDKWKKQMPTTAIQIVERVAGDTLQLLEYEMQYPELMGKPFSTLQTTWYWLDNLQRKIFAPIFFRYLLSLYKRCLTFLRASTFRLWSLLDSAR